MIQSHDNFIPKNTPLIKSHSGKKSENIKVLASIENLPVKTGKSSTTPLSTTKIPPARHSKKIDSNSMVKEVETEKNRLKVKKPIVKDYDTSFICNDNIYHVVAHEIDKLLKITDDFDIPAFLRGSQEKHQHTLNKNEALFQEAVHKLSLMSNDIANMIADGDPNLKPDEVVALTYKQLVGVLDRYDATAQGESKAKGTFLLRSALLIASQNDGVNLESWMVYTKGGKPKSKGDDFWPFLTYWNNWIPEAQGIMAKFTEATWIKTRQLSIQQKQPIVVLLKGGFGAGKTKLAKELFAQSSSGVVAPDAAKQIVRRSLPEASHASAHSQSSQLAYSLFDDFINSLSGTIAYDSSLSRPADVEDYLQKSQAAGKKMEIHDVARNDIARTLAVLRRDVSGEDPRIPPERIIESALLDKMNRVKCMEVILNDTTEDDSIKPVYHLYGSNSQGTDRKEILILSSKKHAELTLGQESKNRLLLEGIKYDTENKKLLFDTKEDALKEFFKEKFKQPVSQLMEQELSDEEKEQCQETFSTRIFTIDQTQKIDSAESLYQALDQSVKNVISQSAFMKAFEPLGTEGCTAFFAAIKDKESISYLDLPLHTALAIHAQLKSDPWNAGQQ